MGRSKFRTDTINKAPSYVLYKFQGLMLEAHREPPILITSQHAAIFRAAHGRDLAEEFVTNSFGLSLVSCMCPRCPFFKHKLGLRPHAGEIVCHDLYEHTQACAPKINDLSHIHVLFKHMQLQDDIFANVLNKIYNESNRLSYEAFERHFL